MVRYHPEWQPGQLRLPPQAAQAEGLREGADAPINQWLSVVT
jgi:hypothetical protein